jgi:hypothetical protein
VARSASLHRRRSPARLLPAALQLAVIAAALACAHASGRARAVPECPGELASTQALAGDFLVRQRMLVTRGDRVFALHLVAQKRGDELLLLGLHPFGAKLFTLRQRGLETSVEALPSPVLEVPPLNVLRDFHRARSVGLAKAGARVTIENDGCGYRAELTTLSEEPLR